nr:MAG TPA: hypothetical protein [Caudoviricetes sp.]
MILMVGIFPQVRHTFSPYHRIGAEDSWTYYIP